MRRALALLVVLTLFTLTGCATATSPSGYVHAGAAVESRLLAPTPPAISHHSPRPHLTAKQRRALHAYLVALRRAALARWLAALAAANVVPPGATTIGDGVPCDGPLTPCWRVRIESGGTWGAYNPAGCYSNGKTGCFGPYQFGWFWAGKLGLPSNLWNATHAQWVSADEQLWDGGRGCGNWSAC